MGVGIAQVGAGGEGATRLVAGQDDGAHFVVVVCLVEMVQQPVGIVLAPAVARLRVGSSVRIPVWPCFLYRSGMVSSQQSEEFLRRAISSEE